MAVTLSEWRPLVPSELAALPESPGVFELATLVRTILYIGTAPESLAAALTHHLDVPGRPRGHVGRLYFRHHATDEPEKIQTGLLAEYRASHGGALPPAQTSSPTPRVAQRHLKAV